MLINKISNKLLPFTNICNNSIAYLSEFTNIETPGICIDPSNSQVSFVNQLVYHMSRH